MGRGADERSEHPQGQGQDQGLDRGVRLEAPEESHGGRYSTETLSLQGSRIGAQVKLIMPSSPADHDESRAKRERGPWTLKRVGREVLEIALIVAVVVGLMSLWQRADQRGVGGKLPTGVEAPAFDLVVMGSGERVRSEDLRGRPTVLNFWATWCGPCRSELPDLAEIYAHQGDRYRLLTVTREPPSVVLPFLEHRRLKLPVLYDPGGKIAARYQVDAIPMTVLLDRQGRVVHDFVGSAYPDILRERLESLASSP